MLLAGGQQLIIDVGGLRSVHPQAKDKPGRKPFKDIKMMKDDAAAVEKTSDEIKAHYTQDLQGVSDAGPRLDVTRSKRRGVAVARRQ